MLVEYQSIIQILPENKVSSEELSNAPPSHRVGQFIPQREL
jgi:hypothetical protein